MYKFKFADVGEGLHEGIVASIHVKVGDSVKDGDDLFTVETEKVTTEIASPVNGVIKKILISEGQTIHVGDVIFEIDDGSKEKTTKVDKPAKKEPETQADESASVVGEVKVSNESLPDIFSPNARKRPARKPTLTTTSSSSLGKTGTIVQGVHILTTPIARLIAKKLGVNINDVKGTGPQGRVLKADVENYATKVQPTGQVTPAKAYASIPTSTRVSIGRKEERVKVTPLRSSIASILKNSWNNVAYTNLVTEINVTKLVKFRKIVRDYSKEKYGINVTFLPFIIKAITKSLKEHPIFNAIYDKKTNELVLKKYYNIGIAVDTPSGLLVPVIKNADQLSILELSSEIIQLAKKARESKLTPKDIQDGTFTITNFGSLRAAFGIPVIKYPELAIVGVGTFFDRAVVVNEKLVNQKLMYLTTAADHRWIDGGDIGRFNLRIKFFLESPELLSV